MNAPHMDYTTVTEEQLTHLAGHLAIAACACGPRFAYGDEASAHAVKIFDWLYASLKEAKAERGRPKKFAADRKSHRGN